MKTLDIAGYRLLNQHIAEQTFAEPGQVVRWLGAMQAQDFGGAKWSVGLRLKEATDSGIEGAIGRREIIRTWPMRGTLHFVAPTDVRWMLALLTPRIIAGTGQRQKALELDAKIFARCGKVFEKALRGGRQISREDMHGLLEAAGITTSGQRGYHILWRLSQEGLLCFAGREGKQHTFALLEEWVPATKSLERDEALANLAKRYFTSHGPATLQDFIWWSGLKAADAKAGLDAVASQLSTEKVDGRIYWMPQSMPTASDVGPVVHLLPGFDEYMLGYKDRGAALDPKHAQKICPGSNGVFAPTVVIDGQVAGTWKRTIKKGAVVIETSPFKKFSSVQQRAIAAAAERYKRFHNGETAE